MLALALPKKKGTKNMKQIFIGLIFILLDLNLGINILPDFVGYLLVWKGCGDLMADSAKLGAVRPVALILTALTAVVFVMNILGLTAGLGILGNIIEIIMVLGSLLVIFMLGKGVCEVEAKYEIELNSVAILNSWKLLALAQVGAYALVLLGKLVSALNIVASIFVLATFLFKVVLLVSAYFCQKMYKEWKDPVQE